MVERQHQRRGSRPGPGQEPGRDSAALGERFAGYEVLNREVLDRSGDRIGAVGEIFVDDAGRPEYIAVDGDGTDGPDGHTALVPMESVSVLEERRAVRVHESRQTVLGGPVSGDGTLPAEYEERLRRYYRLGSPESSPVHYRPSTPRGGRGSEAGSADLLSRSVSGLGSEASSKLVVVCLCILGLAALVRARDRRDGSR